MDGIFILLMAGNIWHINGESCTSISTDTIHWKNRACSGSASPSQCSPMVLYDGKYILGSNGIVV